MEVLRNVVPSLCDSVKRRTVEMSGVGTEEACVFAWQSVNFSGNLRSQLKDAREQCREQNNREKERQVSVMVVG